MKSILQKILTLLAKKYLAKYKPKIVAVTGNTGKTSTKEMIAAVLRSEFKIRMSGGNLNNEWGVPLAILGDYAEEYYEKGGTLSFWLKVIGKSWAGLFFEKSYPKLLKEISSAPILLYLKGNAELLHEKSLGVVGTRTPSSYGRACVETLVEKLSGAGLVIVSGLAQGIDALAHLATLKANGKTIGVLGCGLDQVYPLMNEPLAREMLKKDNLIVSEYPVGTPALKQNFPARNRIIAGLSLGTLVIESKIDGGALITAKMAELGHVNAEDIHWVDWFKKEMGKT